MANEALEFLRQEHLPHIWCPGCGHGIILGAVLRAIKSVQLDRERTVLVSGIGCSSRAVGYADFDTLHTTHGRALAFATGIKLARPDLNVVVIAGDGDLTAIGGNHFLHAARRNIGLTTICFNNQIYGMTSGQASPMTPVGALATTAPHGTIDAPFDLSRLAEAAGATYVARGTAVQVRGLQGLIEKALRHPGFSFVEALSTCPTYYGGKNRVGNGAAMLRAQSENAVNIRQARELPPEELVGKVVVGEFVNRVAPEFAASYAELVQRLQGEG